MDLYAAYQMWGMNYIIFRPHNVYGERQNIGDRYRNVIGIFMNQILRGENITIFGDGEQTRAFTYIKDVSPMIADSILHENAYGHVFNIGSDEVYTVNRLAKIVLEAMGADNQILHHRERNEVKHAFCEHRKASDYLGYGSATGLEEGVRIMADWVKSVGSRKGQDFSNIEVPINMPEAWRR
jgi:UDP-glucose 4-epimerase